MKKIVRQTIDQLNDWKDSFFGDDLVPYSDREYEDLLENISYDGHECYASFLFSQLTEADRKEVLRNIDFEVDFDRIVSYYREHDKRKSS